MNNMAIRPNLASYLLRAIAGIAVFAMDHLATVILQTTRPFFDYHLMAVILSAIAAIVVPHLGKQAVIRDLQDLFLYDLAIQVFGLACAKANINLAPYLLLSIFVYYLKFLRLFWLARSSTGDLLEWPVFGWFGYRHRPHDNPALTKEQIQRIVLALITVLILAEIQRRYSFKPLIPFFVVTLAATLKYCQPLIARLEASQSQLLTTTAELAATSEKAKAADVLAQLAAELALKNQQLETLNQNLAMANDDLEIANDRLESANLALARNARVTTQANHDISPLIGFIHTYADTLLSTPLDATQSQHVNNIRAANMLVAERMEKIIGIQRSEVLEKLSLFSAVKLDEVLYSCEEPFALLARSYQMDFSIKGNSAFTVWSNAEYLQRIIHNLVKNALVHNPPGTRVRIRITPWHAGFIVRILDTGKGIPEAAGEIPTANFNALVQRVSTRETHPTNPSGASSHGIGLQSVAALSIELAMPIKLYTRRKLGAIFEFYLEHAADLPPEVGTMQNLMQQASSE